MRSPTPSEPAEISYERLFQLFAGSLHAECPKLLFLIGTQLSSRLLRASRQASRLAFMDVSNRISRTLLDLSPANGRHGPIGGRGLHEPCGR